MTFQIGLMLLILGITLILFTFEWFAIDIIAIGVLLVLVLTGLLPAEKAFAGFGSDTVIMITGLLILTAALVRTGVVETAGRILLRRTGGNNDKVVLMVMTASATLSSFMSNTAATAFFVPVVMGLARRIKISASKLLMPLAFASILASSVTLVGTSTNVVVSGIITQYGMKPMHMFELTAVGIPIVIVGIGYMFWIGRHLVPERGATEELTEEFNLKPYLTQVHILPSSPWINKTLAETAMGRDLGLTVLRVSRANEAVIAPTAELVIQQDDILLIEGQRDDILKITDAARIGVEPDVMLSDTDLEAKDTHLAEVIVLPRSSLLGRRLVGARLREQYGIQVLAIHRQEITLHRNIGAIPLRLGDVLLVQGTASKLADLERNNTFRILDTYEDKTPHQRRASQAILIFGGVLLLATLNLTTLPVAMLIGTLLVFLTRCITPEEAYHEVDWKIVILIGSMLAFGNAMEHTGTAQYLAGQIARLGVASNPVWLLGGFFLLTVFLTQPMSNQAAAVVILPVAIQTAYHLGLNPRTFAMMIAVAASTSYITPLEPACLMVYGLGHYRFLDFLKVGSLLTLVVFLIAIGLVPLIWPL